MAKVETEDKQKRDKSQEDRRDCISVSFNRQLNSKFALKDLSSTMFSEM